MLIVAEDPLAGAGLAALLADRPECTIVGQVAGKDDVSSALDSHRPDVVVWDLGWDPSDALERLADLGDSRPPVVVLLPDQGHAAEAWAAGAIGLLFRDTDVERLVAALSAAARGLATLEPELASPVGARSRASTPLAEALTPRELEVLGLLAEGLPNKTIAQRLGVSESTVKFHVNAILGKLGAQSRTEAVTRATRLGLILL